MKLTKTIIQDFFKAIRKKDNAKVKSLCKIYPELILSTSPAPPQKDEGQNGLQVALKTENFEIGVRRILGILNHQ